MIPNQPLIYITTYTYILIYKSVSDDKKKTEQFFIQEHFDAKFYGWATHFLGLNFTVILYQDRNLPIYTNQPAYIDTSMSLKYLEIYVSTV